MAKLFGGPKFERVGQSFYGNAQEVLSKPIFAEVANLQDKALLSEDAEAIADRLASAHALTVPRILEKQITIEDMPIDVKQPIGDSKPGTRIRFFIPIEGRSDLLEFGVSGSEDRHFRNAEVANNEIIITYETIKNDPKDIKSQFNEILNTIRANIKLLEHAVSQYNQSIKSEAKNRLQDRINILTKQDWEKALGYPRKQSKPPPQT